MLLTMSFVVGCVVQKGNVPKAEGGELLDTAAAICQQVTHIHASSNVSEVAVEDFVKSFSGAHYQTRVLFNLAQVNAIVRYECMKLTGVAPSAYVQCYWTTFVLTCSVLHVYSGTGTCQRQCASFFDCRKGTSKQG